VRRDEPAARLLVALERRDDLALASVLNPDARMVVDSGDESGGEVRGRARVARSLAGLPTTHPDASFEVVHVNGRAGLALRRRSGEVIGVLAFDLGPDDAIRELWLSTARGKLAHWNRRRPDAG
jgi:hypothetical protein